MPEPIASPVYTLGSWQGNVTDDYGTEWIVEVEDGWSSSPPVRPTLEEKTASDGAWGGPGFYGARVVNLSGRARAADRVGMLAAKDRIKAAIGARTPVTLTVAEEHMTRLASVRLSDMIDIKDQTALIFSWSLTVVAADPRRYGTTVVSESTDLPVGLTTGRTYSRTYPLVYGGLAPGGSGSVYIPQEGDFDQTPAVITFTGPVVTPRVEHVAQNRSLTFDVTVEYGETLVVDLGRQTALLNGSVNRAYTISPGSSWFMLVPGLNELLFRGSVGSAPDGVTPQPQMTVVASSAWT